MSTTLPFALLRPVAGWRPSAVSSNIITMKSLNKSDRDGLFKSLVSATALCYDYETVGTDSWKPETHAVGLALAWTHEPQDTWHYSDAWNHRTVQFVYLELQDELDCLDAGMLLQRLGYERRRTGQHIVAHNAMFDEAISRMHLRRGGMYEVLPDNGLTVSHDTFVAYKALASCGWPGQEWGLKAAMVDVLGWADTNEAGIDEWLISHGYHSNGPDKLETDTPAEHLAKVRAWESTPKKTGGDRPKCGARKEHMGLVPAPILGDYAIQDAVSCLQLHCRVLWPVMKEFPELARFHTDTYLTLIHQLIDQQYAGIRMDKDALERHGVYLQAEIAKCNAILQSHPAIVEIRAADHQAAIDALIAREPKKYNEFKLGKEPTKFKKQTKKQIAAGEEPELSKSWQAWAVKLQTGPQISKSWLGWQATGMALEEKDPPGIKLGSTTIQRLIYGTPDMPGLLPYELGAEPEPDRGRPGTLWVTGRYGKVELDRTKAGKLPGDGVVLLQLADDVLRDTLIKFTDLNTELEFVEQYLGVLHYHPGPAEGSGGGHYRCHPGWIPYGALTGRLTGKGPSLHQLIKSLDFLACFVADPGTVWYEKDWAALEVYVLAEACRDKGLMDLYGPDANPNHDRYLYSAASYPGELGRKVSAYYDKINPTKETTSMAKKACKSERSLAKSVCLAKTYGAGAKKIHGSMRAQGENITITQAKELVQAEMQIFAGVYDEYPQRLSREWEARGGWILSLLGHPIPVYEKYVKDLVNRQCQKSGHDFHVMFVVELCRRLESEGIKYTPIIADFHDQCLLQVPEEHSVRLLQLDKEVTAWLNELLGMTVRLKGEPKLCRNLAWAKLDEVYADWAETNPYRLDGGTWVPKDVV